MYTYLPHIVVLEGDFLTSYFASLGDFSFLGGFGDLVRDLTSELRDHIDFNPRDDSDEEETAEEDTDEDGFNVRRFLEGVVSRFEDTAIQQFAQQSAELGQCIRRVVEVILTPSFFKLVLKYNRND